MTKVLFRSESPYANTNQVNVYLEYLDFWKGSYFLPDETDTLYTVQSRYEHRPDLLSFDLYGSPAWWWTFSVRNPDILKDPIYDLKSGISIYAVSKKRLPRKAM